MEQQIMQVPSVYKMAHRNKSAEQLLEDARIDTINGIRVITHPEYPLCEFIADDDDDLIIKFPDGKRLGLLCSTAAAERLVAMYNEVMENKDNAT